VADGVRSYTDEELEAILRRAIERQTAAGDGFGHDELVAAAREVGLDEDAVERAIAELSDERSEQQIRDGIRRRRRERWLRHLITYLAVVGGLLGLHAMAIGGVGTWVFWVAFGWGIGLVLDTYNKLRAPTDEEVDRERRRLNRHERRRARAEARREAKRRRAEERTQRRARGERRSQTSEQLERVIDEGVSLLLGAAAKKIREAAEQMEHGQPAPDTEFGRYVERRKAGRTAAPPPESRPPRERPRGRVEDDPPHEQEEVARELERRRPARKTRR
jgi:hypothetical protein